MKLLVISDVHGNLPALKRVLEEDNDGVVFLGDIAGYGPDVPECIDLLRDSLILGVRGNHDHALSSFSSPGCMKEMEKLAEITHELTLLRMSDSDMEFLSSLPVARGMKIEGVTVYGVHATFRNPLYEYFDSDSSDEEIEDAFPQIISDFIFCGHSHIPFLRETPFFTLVNPGSVGHPRDGDWRASFCILETSDNSIEFKRVEYPFEEFERRMKEEEFPERLIEIVRKGHL
jgi:putative phosphoesterase